MKKRIPGYKKEMLPHIRKLFAHVENIERNYSQAWQDMFVLTALHGKRNGTYLEIGAQDPIIKSNTYLLEQCGWTGVSIDIVSKYKSVWKEKRTNPLHVVDATKANYKTIFKQYSLPKKIDYLQLDTDPAEITFQVLKKIPWNDCRFSVITYEHDLYTGHKAAKLRLPAREFLTSKGYTMIVGNVCNTLGKPFEDWWIANEDLTDLLIIPDFNLPSGYYFLNEDVTWKQLMPYM